MKLNTQPRVGIKDPLLQKELGDHASQVNLLSEGRMAAKYTATTAAPTTGTHARGDEVPNSEPAVLGGAGSRYVIVGWKCVTGGEPGTWVEMRTLTGT